MAQLHWNTRVIARIGSWLRGSRGNSEPVESLPPGAGSWVHMLGMTPEKVADNSVTLLGSVAGASCKVEIGPPTRDYIVGEELRARAELGTDPTVAVILMQRELKNTLERRAYSTITDSLQTSVHEGLTEEMRWLAIYNEVAWRGVPEIFWQRYAVLARDRDEAIAWCNDGLVELLLQRPASTQRQPLLLAVLRGKCYLRAQHGDPGSEGLSGLLVAACESAIQAFR